MLEQLRKDLVAMDDAVAKRLDALVNPTEMCWGCQLNYHNALVCTPFSCYYFNDGHYEIVYDGGPLV